MKSARKEQLASLLLGGLAPDASSAAGAVAPETKSDPRIRGFDQPPGRVVSGSVKAMSRSLGELGAAAAEVETLKAQMAAGDQVVALDPALVDPSFVTDRLDASTTDGGDFAEFLADLRDHGQQVPVLVRPHPSVAGRYQIAYGHRRLAAARQLGRPVRALVKRLSDAELVVAQGQENAQRRDLSFIEKALFAHALSERGFDRATLVAALAVQTAEITRLLAVARAIPLALAAAIGPAPKAGRPRWMALAELIDTPGALARAQAAVAAGGGDSDARFARAYAAAVGAPSAPAPEADVVLRDDKGRALARLSRRGSVALLALDEALEPEFAAHVAAALPGLHAAFRTARGPGGPDQD